jgi:hypothetical protein
MRLVNPVDSDMLSGHLHQSLMESARAMMPRQRHEQVRGPRAGDEFGQAIDGTEDWDRVGVGMNSQLPTAP